MEFETWEKYFSGYSIVDALIFNVQRIAYCLKEDPPQGSPTAEDDSLGTRLVIHRRDEDEDKAWVHVDFPEGLKRPRLLKSAVPDEKLLIVDFWGHVYALGGGVSELEADIGLEPGVSLCGGNCIGGRAYVVGSERTVISRGGRGRWARLSTGLTADSGKDGGFCAIDGFDEQDLYAAGGLSGVWHYDGEAWRRTGFPPGLEVRDLCVGADGNVYVACVGGKLLVGRNDRWTLLNHTTADDFERVAWFGGEVFVTSWTGMWRWSQGAFVEVEHLEFGHVCSGDGLLLSSGPKESLLWESESWQVVVPDCSE